MHTYRAYKLASSHQVLWSLLRNLEFAKLFFYEPFLMFFLREKTFGFLDRETNDSKTPYERLLFLIQEIY